MGPRPEFGCGPDTKNPSDCGAKSTAAGPGAWAEAPCGPGDSMCPWSLLWRSSRRTPMGIPCLCWASCHPPPPIPYPKDSHGGGCHLWGPPSCRPLH